MSRRSMGRQAVKGYAEEDAYTSWRRMYCYLAKAGAVRYIKRTTHRRVRREAKIEIHKEAT